MTQRFYDTSIDRKSQLVDNSRQAPKRVEWPLPGVVEISESGTCNRKCSFCPRSAPDYVDVKEFIDPHIIEKLSSELGALGYSGIFLFSGFVEPMLDKNIFSLIATARRNMPDARIEMVTNGDVLNVERARKLVESGLSTLLISVYDGPEDVDRLEAVCKEAGYTDDQYVIRKRYLPQSESFGITLSNRSGMMANAEFSIETPVEPLKSPCYYPHYTFFMDYTGDVLTCPHDWGRKKVLGNMRINSFEEIWNGRGYRALRNMLVKGNRGFAPCNTCDVTGTLMGETHVKAWDAYDQATKANGKD